MVNGENGMNLRSSGLSGTISLEPYSDNMDVLWTIGKDGNCTMVQIEVEHFEIEEYDSLTIGHNTYTGSSLQVRASQSQLRQLDAPLKIKFRCSKDRAAVL